MVIRHLTRVEGAMKQIHPRLWYSCSNREESKMVGLWSSLVSLEGMPWHTSRSWTLALGGVTTNYREGKSLPSACMQPLLNKLHYTVFVMGQQPFI